MPSSTDRSSVPSSDGSLPASYIGCAAVLLRTSSASASEGAAGEAVCEAVIAAENLQLVKVTVLAAIRDAVA